MRWTRQQYLDYMTFTDASRPMFCELFGPLIGLPQEWRAQGASDEEIGMTAFDWDYVPVMNCGGNTHPICPPAVTLHENDEERIERDGLGRTTKLCKATATIALPLDFPVQTMDDWLRLKPMYEDQPERVSLEQIARAKSAQALGTLIVLSIPGAYDTLRELMGEEQACLAYYDQPELVQDILSTIAQTSVSVAQRVLEHLTIDQLSVHEDFAGRSGPLVGPGIIREHFKPYYQSVWSRCVEAGARIFQQDTDGNINPVLEALADTGLTSVYPMEPAAGMDPVQVRTKFGKRWMMLGGIDKHVLRQDKAAIRKELEYKMQPMMRSGGMVFALDHRIPNGTSLENYRYYVNLGREILGLPPVGQGRGWARMAF